MKKKWCIFPDGKPYAVTSPYGMRTLNGVTAFHDGTDFGVPVGTPLCFRKGGTIRLATADKFGGKYIQLRDTEGKGHVHLHVSEFLKKVGDKVKAGEVVALSGNTGLSTAPHDHYMEQQNAEKWDSHYDPMGFLYAEDLTALGINAEYIVTTKVDNVRLRTSAMISADNISKLLPTGSVLRVLSQSLPVNDGYCWINVKDSAGSIGYVAYLPEWQDIKHEPEKPVEPEIPEVPQDTYEQLLAKYNLALGELAEKDNAIVQMREVIIGKEKEIDKLDADLSKAMKAYDDEVIEKKKYESLYQDALRELRALQQEQQETSELVKAIDKWVRQGDKLLRKVIDWAKAQLIKVRK